MALNAVERRLVELRLRWEAFAENPVPRLLVWTAPDAAMRLVRCFFAAQKSESEYTARALFVVLDAPFEHAIQYSQALKEALAGQYAASREDLAREGLGSAWNADAAAFPDSAYGFTQMLRSFGGTYHRSIGHLVAVLMPASVSSDARFTAWLGRALDADLPERLRLLVVDSLGTPRLSDLRPVDPAQVWRETLALDATAVATETFAQERTVGPAGVFRNMLMALVALVEKGSLTQVQLKGADALAYVRKQGWKDQEVVVTMLVAGAMLKDQRFDHAIGAYREARATAGLAQQDGHPAASAMVLQTWFGEAGVELAAGRTREATTAYEQAAVVAQADRNAVLAIEAHRMAAFCRANLGEREAAIDRIGSAFKIGERLRPAVRIMTTLPIAANDLLILLDKDRADAIEAIRARAKEREETLAGALDQHAAQHERTAEPTVFRDALDANNQRSCAGSQIAEGELIQLVAGASGPFQHAFRRARVLLGRDWPLFPSKAVAGPAPAQMERQEVALA
jgi:tetratricopeptide (TPR) repeat protein